jgi:hypothetical protein
VPVSPEEVVQLWRIRLTEQGPHLNRLREIADYYQGDLVIPMPELDAAEKPAVANLLAQAVDQLAIRTSGVLPDLRYFPTDPKEQATVERARTARAAMQATWDQNDMSLLFAGSAQKYYAYGTTGFIVKHVSANYWDKRPMPHFHELDPLHTFSAPSASKYSYEPRDVIKHSQQTLGWLKAMYPEQAARIYKGAKPRIDKMFDLLEYNDEFETVLVLVGQTRGMYDHGDYEQGVSSAELLERVENRAGVCLAVQGGRVTLERVTGQFDQLLGLFYNQAKLQAYELIGIQRTIFPEQWVVSHPNAPGEARILQLADSKQGDIGEIANGTIMTVTPTLNQMTGMTIDRLAGEIHRGAQLPAEVGGDAGQGIRTAKRGVSVMQSAMDPNIQQAQNVYSKIFRATNERAMAVSKAYWGNKMISFYTNKRDGKNIGEGDYRPNDAYASEWHSVVFSMPGVDAAGIPIELAQRTGAGLMSLDTARRSDPMIEDPEAERNAVQLDSIDKVVMQQLMQPGAIDPHEAALMMRIRIDNPSWDFPQVIDEAHKQVQAQQAAQAQQEPGEPGGQPGLGLGAGPQAQGPQQGPPPSVSQLLQSLRTPTNQSGAEQQLGGTAPQPQGGQ